MADQTESFDVPAPSASTAAPLTMIAFSLTHYRAQRRPDQGYRGRRVAALVLVLVFVQAWPPSDLASVWMLTDPAASIDSKIRLERATAIETDKLLKAIREQVKDVEGFWSYLLVSIGEGEGVGVGIG